MNRFSEQSIIRKENCFSVTIPKKEKKKKNIFIKNSIKEKNRATKQNYKRVINHILCLKINCAAKISNSLLLAKECETKK